MVVDEQQNPIAYALLHNGSKDFIGYSNDQGRFNGDTFSVADTVMISCIGYHNGYFIITKAEFDTTILLRKAAGTIDEVVVTTRRQKWETVQLGNKMKYAGNAFLEPGYETGVYLAMPSRPANAYLQSVYFYITDIGYPTSKFRIHIYERDELTKQPGRDITDSNLIVNASQGGAWLKVNLKDKYIRIDKGIFVCMEWIGGYGNSDSTLTFNGIAGDKYYKMTNRGYRKQRLTATRRKKAESMYSDIKFKGQVLGLASNKYGQSTWSYNRRYGNFWIEEPGPLIPMIYATCIYHD